MHVQIPEALLDGHRFPMAAGLQAAAYLDGHVS
jgi:hypothetical protein